MRLRAIAALCFAAVLSAVGSAQAAPSSGRVVFLGASVMEYWAQVDPGFFSAHPNYVDRGVAGETTDQILERTPRDVLPLNPSVVVILGGTNDADSVIHPERTVRNLAAIVDVVRGHGAKVVLCGITSTWAAEGKGTAELNALIGAYARAHGLPFVDFAPLRAPGGQFRPGLTREGVHPTLDGYKLMEPLVQAAIDQVVATARP